MAISKKLQGVELKVQRAKKHITDLEAAIVAFKKSSPDRICGKYDPETRRQIYYVASIGEIPPQLSLIAGDALNCLRSALDQLVYQIWLTCGSSGRERSVAFPI